MAAESMIEVRPTFGTMLVLKNTVTCFLLKDGEAVKRGGG